MRTKIVVGVFGWWRAFAAIFLFAYLFVVALVFNSKLPDVARTFDKDRLSLPAAPPLQIVAAHNATPSSAHSAFVKAAPTTPSPPIVRALTTRRAPTPAKNASLTCPPHRDPKYGRVADEHVDAVFTYVNGADPV